ncbi:MAG: glucose-6-phosphate dehydrogenase assembly protein OpcA [Gloeomargaritaceae cyanobacterium C42_A2020_066]|nr:glucose-6-phosphate dehydrogenase assembly protein OpcA [Gloeomargaritaceae cyanobacterium C42_A2020_066]
MSPPLEAVVSLHPPKDVSIGEIEQELSRIWQGSDGAAGPSAVRAATFTLLVYEPEAPTGVPSPSVEAMAAQNPCRVIDLCPLVSDDDTGLQAQVAAYCPLQKRGHSNLICCEYITLQGSMLALERATGLISGLLINDLPTYLWWQAMPDPNHPLLRSLVGLGQSTDLTSGVRVIVDSSIFSDPEIGLQQVRDLQAAGIPVADLNWRRLAAWQELTAEVFDPPERRVALPDLDQVVIDYERGNSAQALLFLGWLAGRLGWQPQSRHWEDGDYALEHIHFQSPAGRPIVAELAAIPLGEVGAVLGDLVGLRLDSTNAAANCCTVLCSSTTGCMRLEAGGKAQSCHVEQVEAPLDQLAEDLLGPQIQRWGQQNQLYAESLAVAADILNVPRT